jgi:hypothetical protein
MTSTLPKGIILGSVASLLAATLYEGNPNRVATMTWLTVMEYLYHK